MFLIFPKTFDQIRVCAQNIRDVSGFGPKHSNEKYQLFTPNFEKHFSTQNIGEVFDFGLEYSKSVEFLRKKLTSQCAVFCKDNIRKYLVLTQNI